MFTTVRESFDKFCAFDRADFTKSESFYPFIGALSYLVEKITNSEPETLKEFLFEIIEKDLFLMAPWLRLIIVRNVMYKSPNDIEFFDWAIGDLSLFYDTQSPIILELEALVNK